MSEATEVALEEGAVFSAVFQPDRTDDLRGAGASLIGQRLELIYEDGYIYISAELAAKVGFWWIPWDDLKDVQIIDDPAPRHWGNPDWHWSGCCTGEVES